MRTNAPVLFSLTFVFLCLAASGTAQDRQPVSAGVRVVESANSPVTVSLNGSRPLARDRAAINYIVTNASGRNIRALVIVVVPGTAKCSVMFGGPLRPGAAETFNFSNFFADSGNPEISVDFVLFDDGTTWGANTARDGDRLMGVYDGQRAAYADAVRLTESSNERDLAGWLQSAEVARNPPGMRRILNTQWSAGYLYGYTGAHQLFRHDYDRRGLVSISLRLRAMERDLGLPSREVTAVKP